MKTILFFLSTFAFCDDVFSQIYDPSFVEEQYLRKYEQLDKTVYTLKSFVLIKHPLSENIRYTFLLVSRDVQGTRVTFYLDSLMHFHRNGHLKFIQASDSIGTPTFTRMYDKNGQLVSECKYTYKGVIPYQPTKKASKEALICYTKKYKNGILISEGLNVGGKKEGMHVTYDKDGKIKTRIVYLKGKIIE